MIKKLIKSLFLFVLTLVFIGGSFAVPSFAASSQKTALFEYFTATSSLQEYVDTTLAESAGTTHGDWLFFGLMRLEPTLDNTAYLSALKSKTNGSLNITDRERIALLYSMCDSKNTFIDSVLSLNPNSLTVNETIYALILLDSNAYTSETLDRDTLITRLISMQLDDGGWALSGKIYDIDITAMAIQSLAPYMSFEDVYASVSKGVSLLSAKQTENGDYKSRGIPTCESTAQVIITLHSLGIDPKTDSRFIKNGNTVYDGLSLYQDASGAYSHTVGSNVNGIATAQAACALASAELFENGGYGLYRFTSELIPRKPSSSSEEASSSSVASNSSESLIESTASSAEEAPVSDFSSASETIADNDPLTEVTKTISYKYIACFVVILIFLILCIILFAKGKFSLKNLVPLALSALVLILLILFVNITSVKKHYSAELESPTEGSPTITFSVNAKVILEKDTELPEDGYIIPHMEYVVSDETTPFSALLDITIANGIKLDYNGSPDNPLAPVYITSISNISEKQYGALSGWLYKVNGVSPDVSCSEYKLKAGDKVEWIYTLELGKDVEADE